VRFLELPDQPDEPRHREHTRAGSGDQPTPKRRELPDPEERGRTYELIRAHTSAEKVVEPSDAAGESQHDRQADAAGQRGYRGEVPRFMQKWADHETRWPTDRRTTADLSADTSAPHHGDGESWQYSVRRAESAAEAIGRTREAEPGLSADAQAIEQENKHGGWLDGFKHRLKGEDRLKEKIAERLEGEPDKSLTEILRKFQTPFFIRSASSQRTTPRATTTLRNSSKTAAMRCTTPRITGPIRSTRGSTRAGSLLRDGGSRCSSTHPTASMPSTR